MRAQRRDPYAMPPLLLTAHVTRTDSSASTGFFLRVKESERRFVAPLHLLCVERPAGALPQLRRPGSKRSGTVLRESACGRHVYVLHLGSRLQPKARYRLEEVR